MGLNVREVLHWRGQRVGRTVRIHVRRMGAVLDSPSSRSSRELACRQSCRIHPGAS